MSNSEIARRTGRSRAAIRRVVSSADFERAKEIAKNALAEGLADFVSDWRRASRVAAEKGHHEPSMDAMLSLGAINKASTATQSGGFVVKIGVLLPGLGPTATLAMNSGETNPAETIEGVLDESH